MITVNSGFDGGAISVIRAESADNIQLQINTDNQSCTRQWFYFSVGTTRARQQTIRLINASQSSFAEAWHGYQAFASYDNEHWFRVDTRYQQGELVLTHQSSEKLVYYAYFVPYSASRETRLLQELSEHSAVNLTKLGKTPLGRDITLIRIGSLQSGARKVWLMARQHPGETMSQWVAEGVIKHLTSHFATQHAAVNITFYIVANMNPDGAALGNHRTNANGINLNRHWATPDPERCPEVYFVKQAMLQTGVDILVDIHGDEMLPYNFIMSETKHPFVEQIKHALAIEDDNFQSLYDYNNTLSACNNADCGSGCGQLKATTFVHQQFAVPALLLESPFKAIQAKGESKNWDHTTAVNLGASLARVLIAASAP